MQVGINPAHMEADDTFQERALLAAQNVERAVNDILLSNKFLNVTSVKSTTGEPVYIGGFKPADKNDIQMVQCIGIISATAVDMMPGGITNPERIWPSERLHDEMRYVDEGSKDVRSYR